MGRIITRASAAIAALLAIGGIARAQLLADRVLLNGKIVTVDKNFSIREAIAISGSASSPPAPRRKCAP